MDPSCLSFLRCFLCCQDEIDDSYYVDVDLGDTRTSLSHTIRNLFRKTSSHSDYTIVVSHSPSPASVPRNNTANHRSSHIQSQRSLQNDNEARQVLRAELLSALLRRSQTQIPSPSRPPQPASSPQTRTSSSKLPQSSFVSSSPTPRKPAKPSTLYKTPESLMDSPSSSRSDSSSQKQRPILKPVLTMVSHQQGKSFAKDSLPLYLIPDNVKELIKKDIAPDVLKKPVSPSTYKDFFSILLYAEEYYHEKWSKYKLENVTLELRKAAGYKKLDKRKGVEQNEEKDDTIFVSFKIDDIRERRPFLLSRDLAYARPSGSKDEPFQVNCLNLSYHILE